MRARLNSFRGALLTGALAAVPALCEEPVDVEFLEFLGTWDNDDENWGEFVDMAGDDPLLAERQPPGTNDENLGN